MRQPLDVVRDAHYLYFLCRLRLCPFVDALAAVATVRSIRQPSKGVFGPKIKMLVGRARRGTIGPLSLLLVLAVAATAT